MQNTFEMLRLVYVKSIIIWGICFLLEVNASEDYVVHLSHDGPVVLGGTITFRADLQYDDGTIPSGQFKYTWQDDAFVTHTTTITSTNTTVYWNVPYSRDTYFIGSYKTRVVVEKKSWGFFWTPVTSGRISFKITSSLNGNMTLSQANKTLEGPYISSAAETNATIKLRPGDYDLIAKKATSVLTYWFIDFKYLGSSNFNEPFAYNFTNTEIAHTIEALVMASYDPPQTPSPPIPPTDSTNTTVAPLNSTIVSPAITNSTIPPTTPATTTNTTALPSSLDLYLQNRTEFINVSSSEGCANSIIPRDPDKTYGYFCRTFEVRDPIADIKVEGTNWIQPWDMLNLNVTCKGSGPVSKCLQFHRGKYNITGNETCDDPEYLNSCNFSIVRYFLEPSVYTVLVILENEISTKIYPVTINIYKVTTKPQLSVIVVPVSCSLAAVVLIVFGVSYYIQNRERFTIEVADFDFGQNNPEMEYKTFTERLRDSFESAVRPGNKRISEYEPFNNPTIQ